ncbi:MAG: transposase [Verrucomicrobiia bacterium]|jgi:REP element-mobilizing transposase RayT
MSQSLAKNLIYLIYSTKDRRAVLDEPVREELHRYSAGILASLDSPALLIGSVADHIHILFNLHRTKALADVVMELKRGSSKWLKMKGGHLADFAWQNGYGAFSVSQSSVSQVRDYILAQAEHHKQTSFQNELRAFLRRYEIEFDEQYVWD